MADLSRKVLINVPFRSERVLIDFSFTILVEEAQVPVKMHLLLSFIPANS